MNSAFSCIQLSLLAFLSTSVQAQGSFRNLGFEEALIAPGIPGGKVPTGIAIPGWSAFLDGSLLAEISYQQFAPFRSDITLFDLTSGARTLDGLFSLSLFSVGIGDTSIRQTGTVPQSSRFLLFKLGPRDQNPVPDWSTQPTIRVNGEVINYEPLEFGLTYSLYAAEISPFAGQSVTLEFAAIRPPRGVSAFFLDSIEFSNIPEPKISVLILLALAIHVPKVLFKNA